MKLRFCRRFPVGKKMEPIICIAITTEAVAAPKSIARTDCGAVLDFVGVVRAEENGSVIEGLFYEAYQPMAQQQMECIARELLNQHPCREVHVVHRIGFVATGEPSILVRVAARHRGEAISFLADFMNRLKMDVPIWKRTSQSNAPPS